MRRLLAGISACAAALAAAVITLPSASDVAPADASQVSDAAVPLLSSDVTPAGGSAVSDTSASSRSAPSPVPACGSGRDGNGPSAPTRPAQPPRQRQTRLRKLAPIWSKPRAPVTP